MKLKSRFMTFALLYCSLALHVRQFADNSAAAQLGSIFGTAIDSQILKAISQIGSPGTPASGTTTSDVSDFAQATPTNRVEPRCYDECNNAFVTAQQIGRVYSKLCDPNGDFSIGWENCHTCSLLAKTTFNGAESSQIQLNRLGTFTTWCVEQSIRSVQSCAVLKSENPTAVHTNCTGFPSRTSPASETRPNVPTPTPSQPPNQSSTPIGAIAGSVTAAIVLLAVLAVSIILIRRRRCRRQHTLRPDVPEKAQLHSDAFTPIRGEVAGSGVAWHLLQRRSSFVAEMSAADMTKEMSTEERLVEVIPTDQAPSSTIPVSK